MVNKCRYGKRYRVRYALYGLIIIEGSAFIYIYYFLLFTRKRLNGGGAVGEYRKRFGDFRVREGKNFIRGVAIYPTERRKVRRQVEEERKRKTDPATDRRRRTVNKTFMGSKKKKKNQRVPCKCPERSFAYAGIVSARVATNRILKVSAFAKTVVINTSLWTWIRKQRRWWWWCAHMRCPPV